MKKTYTQRYVDALKLKIFWLEDDKRTSALAFQSDRAEVRRYEQLLTERAQAKGIEDRRFDALLLRAVGR